MSSRGIALGRIIDWARNADPEEARYALYRMTAILNERTGQQASPAVGKKPRKPRAAKPPENAVQEQAATAS